MQLVLPEYVGRRGSRAELVHQVARVLQAEPVPQVALVLPVDQDLLATPVTRAPQAIRGVLDRRARLQIPVPRELQVLPDPLVSPDLVVLPQIQVLPVIQVPQELLAFQAHRDQLGRPAIQVPRVALVPPDTQVRLDLSDRQVMLLIRVQRVTLGPLASPAL